MQAIYEPKGRAKEYSHLALNIFSGCLHGCYYCYASDMAKRYGREFDKPHERKDILESVRNDAQKLMGINKRVLLCFTCDPYQPQIDTQITREVIIILRQHKIPFQILTKGGLRAERDFDLYGSVDAFASTLTFMDEVESKRNEPLAAIPEDRFEAIRRAKKKGIETWVSLEPVLDVKQGLEIIDQTHEFVDLYKVGKLNHRKNNTDWEKWAKDAMGKMIKYKKKYYFKEDLVEYFKPGELKNIDTRCVEVAEQRELFHAGSI